jgi:hypothetical protein
VVVQSVQWLGYGLYDRGSRVPIPARAGIFLFTTASRTALVPTQPPIQRKLGVLSVGVKRPGHEADHSPPSSVEVKEWVELNFTSPIRLPCVMLSSLNKAHGQLYLYFTLLYFTLLYFRRRRIRRRRRRRRRRSRRRRREPLVYFRSRTFTEAENVFITFQNRILGTRIQSLHLKRLSASS